MTPDQITKLSQHLSNIVLEIGSVEPNPTERRCLKHAIKALALLPCPICNGTGIMMRCVVEKTTGELVSQNPEPCPDCQPRTCVYCEEITEENAHLHRNCGK